MRTSAEDSREIRVFDVSFNAAPRADVERGLLGFTRFTVSGILRLDSVALRRTLDGHLALSFPARRDRRGDRHQLVCPVNDRVRLEIEHQVFEALGFPQGNPR